MISIENGSSHHNLNFPVSVRLLYQEWQAVPGMTMKTLPCHIEKRGKIKTFLEEIGMDRLELVRRVVDNLLLRQPDEEERRCGFVHLYGVSLICNLLAIKRRLDSQLCGAAGMLHDISSYMTGDSQDHAHRSSVEAERILKALGCFTAEDIRGICTAIACHGEKEKEHGPMEELLKDADVVQHYFYNPVLKEELRNHKRVIRVLREL
jgi:uncharacterized protein